MSRVRAALEPALDEAASVWFADGVGLSLGNVRAMPRSVTETGGSRSWLFGEDLALTATPGALRALAESALQYRSGAVDGAGLVARTLEALALRQWCALAAIMRERLGAGPAGSIQSVPEGSGTSDMGPCVVATLAFAPRDLRFSLAISARLLRPSQQGRTPRSPARVDSRVEALRETPVPAVAAIGRARLRVSDLAALRRGDVLLLDRRTDDAVDVRLGRPACVTLMAYPCAVGKRAALQFAVSGSPGRTHGR